MGAVLEFLPQSGKDSSDGGFGAGDQNSVTWGSGPRISSKRICRWPGAVVESARVPLRLSIEAMV